MSLNLIKNGDTYRQEYVLKIPNGSGVDTVLSNLSIEFDPSFIGQGVAITSASVGTVSSDNIQFGDVTCQGQTDSEGKPVANTCLFRVTVNYEITEAANLPSVFTISGKWKYVYCEEDEETNIKELTVRYDDCSCIHAVSYTHLTLPTKA